MPAVTLGDLLRDAPLNTIPASLRGNNKTTRAERAKLPRALDGLKPKPAPAREGLLTMTPENLAALRVDVVEVNGSISGYQRDLDIKRARRIADELRAGKPVPPISVALDGRGVMWDVDGQHRAAGAILARVPIHAAVQKMSKAEAKELFLSQQKATRVSRDVLTLAGTDPLATYIQAAILTNGHPWHGIVSARRDSKTMISPYVAYQLLLRYVYNVEGQGASTRYTTKTHYERWDVGLADDLAPLIRCFGNKQTNPLAFKTGTVQAIGGAAMHVFRRNTTHDGDHERWVLHMPTFRFENYVHVTGQLAKTDWLLAHWNKRLSGKRRVSR